jgi:hypothetical protein
VSIPFAGSLGESISNAVIDAAWGTVFDRGIGGAIQGAVDGAAGIVPKEEQAKAKLPVGEHVLRAGTRAAAVGATTYLLGNSLNPIMVQLGTSLGGVGGALVAMAGAALIGSVGASVVDATVGAKLGQFGGSLYSWITGRDNFEARAAKQAAVGSTTPADSTTPAGSATPTTSVAHTPASPQRAPIAGAPRRRRTTGQQAVDRTSPAILLTPARLAQIAAAG